MYNNRWGKLFFVGFFSGKNRVPVYGIVVIKNETEGVGIENKFLFLAN